MHLERVRRSPQRGGSRDCQARWRWRRAPLRVVKMCQQHGVFCLPAVLPRTLDANLRGAACGASLWAAECGMHDIWPCGGVRLREMRVEGHGSPRAINKCALLLCCFRSFYSSAAIPERSPTPLHYPLYTYTRASSHAPRVLVASAPCSRPTTTPPTTDNTKLTTPTPTTKPTPTTDGSTSAPSSP